MGICNGIYRLIHSVNPENIQQSNAKTLLTKFYTAYMYACIWTKSDKF